MSAAIVDVTEQKRLNEAREAEVPWKKWGPYLSERQWGTVREDYSDDGNAWNYFTHDQARSRAYKWGEDGLGGLCDDKQRLCFAARAVERARSDPEGAPLRPHQQRGQPRRGREGVLLLRRQHADALVHEVPVQVSAARVSVPGPDRDQPRDDRGRSSSTSSSTPASSTTTGTSTCSSNTRRKARKTCWSASPSTIAGPTRRGCASCRRCGFATPGRGATTIASLRCAQVGAGHHSRVASRTGRLLAPLRRRLRAALHRKREQRAAPVGPAQRVTYVKDAFHAYVIAGQAAAVNPAKVGTKAAVHYVLDVPAGGSKTIRLRLAAARTRTTRSAISRRPSRAASPTRTNSMRASRRER